MTVRKWVKGYCINRGMTREQAGAVADAVMARGVQGPFLVPWSYPVSYLPAVYFPILEVAVQNSARRWLDDWCPGSPLRAHFV